MNMINIWFKFEEQDKSSFLKIQYLLFVLFVKYSQQSNRGSNERLQSVPELSMWVTLQRFVFEID